ncbi:MAG: hypothetical protein EHM32_10825, partial [Spirochaetales bacterium]
MKTLRALAILRHFSSAVRAKRLGAMSFLCIALLPNTSQIVVQNDRVLEIRKISTAAPSQLEVIGVWPYGLCEASAIDTTRNIALIGNGETLQVLDISSPSATSQIGEVRIEGSAQDIVLTGNYACLVTRNYFLIVDLTDPENPRETASVFFPGQHFRSVRLSANGAYLASEQGLFIYDVSNPYQPVFQAHYTHDNIDIFDVAVWGKYALCLGQFWKPPERQELIYCLEIVDISFPAAPVLVGTFDLGKDYVLREIEVSAAGNAYVCQSTERREAGRLLIIDISTDPVNPSEIGRYLKADKGLEGIALSGRYAYLLES